MMPPFATPSDLKTALTRFNTEARWSPVQTDRYLCRSVVWGESDRLPVVFIHGLTDQARSFVMVMARLVDAGFRCVGYELPNGRDDGANLGSYQHPDLVADLIALLDHLKIDRADLLGSSFGTTVAQRALATHPERFRRGILKGGFARRPLRWTERGPARLAQYWPLRLGQLPGYRLVMARLEGRGFSYCPPEIFEYLLTCSGATPVRAVTRRALMLDTVDLRPLLSEIPHPILMIGGDLDGIVFRWCEQEVEEGLKNAQRVELSPCGHYPQYTMPGPTADAIIHHLS